MAVLIATLVLFLITGNIALLGGKKCEFSIEREGKTDVKVTKPSCDANLIHVEVSGQTRSKDLKTYAENFIVMWPNSRAKKEWALFKGPDGNFFWSRFEPGGRKKMTVLKPEDPGKDLKRTATGEKLSNAQMVQKMKDWIEEKTSNPYNHFLMEKNGPKSVWARGKKAEKTKAKVDGKKTKAKDNRLLDAAHGKKTEKTKKTKAKVDVKKTKVKEGKKTKAKERKKTKAKESIYDLYDQEEDDEYNEEEDLEETALENELDDALNQMFQTGYEQGLAAARKRKRYRYQY